jgi:hypothetical protein
LFLPFHSFFSFLFCSYLCFLLILLFLSFFVTSFLLFLICFFLPVFGFLPYFCFGYLFLFIFYSLRLPSFVFFRSFLLVLFTPKSAHGAVVILLLCEACSKHQHEVITLVTNWGNQFVCCMFQRQYCILLNHGSLNSPLNEFGLKEHICLIACYKSRENGLTRCLLGGSNSSSFDSPVTCLLNCGSSTSRSAPILTLRNSKNQQ